MKRKSIFLPVALLMACAAIARQSIDETGPATPPTPEPPVISSPDINGVVVEPERPQGPALKIKKVRETPIRSDDPASRAWTTTVGWHPGASALPDPVTHEARLNGTALPGWLKQLANRGE